MSDYNNEGKPFFNISELKERIGKYIVKFKQNPAFAFVVIGFSLVFIYFTFFSDGGKVPKVHPLQETTVPFEDQDEMVGVRESVDPRDVWTAKVEQRVKATKEELDQEVRNKHQESIAELEKIKQELLMLKDTINLQKTELERKQIEENIRLSNSSANYQVPIVKARKTLGVFSKNYGSKKNNLMNYVPSGAFARAVLTTGIMAGTGSNAASNPEPIRLRLTDVGILSKNLRTDQIKDAILIGDCVGDFGSERAKCRIQTISLENNKGEIIERPVNGWVFGEDGRYGVKGEIVDKSSDLLRLAMLNGLLGGISNFFQSQATKGAFPMSPLTGQQNALSTKETLKGGLAAGAGEAFSKISDFIMDRINAISPQIAVESAREVDVMFQKGFDLNDVMDEERAPAPDGNFRGADYYEDPRKQNNKYLNENNNFAETFQRMNSGMNQEETEDGF